MTETKEIIDELVDKVHKEYREYIKLIIVKAIAAVFISYILGASTMAGVWYYAK